MLRTDTLEKSTLDLLKRLQKIPLLSELRLVGGTALALQLGHRRSVDLDFFGQIDAEGLQIVDEMYNNGLEDIVVIRDTRTIKIFTVNKIKVDIVSYRYKWLEPPIEIDNVKLADIKDIAAMKLAAVTNRGTKKDFIDIFFLLQQFTIKQMMKLYEQKFTDGSIFNVIRSLTYFEDSESDIMPEMLIPVDWLNVKQTIREAVIQFQETK